MRVTENMRFHSTVQNLFNAQSHYNDIMEKLASQKMVNRASDDPIAATKIIELQQGKSANEQYRKNMDNADAWIASTESKLSNAYDMLVRASEVAMAQATATANSTTRRIGAREIQSIIEEMANLANTKMGDRYLFSGTANSAPPFSTTRLDAAIDAAAAAGNNAFSGSVSSAGTYTGTGNNTYVLKITHAGALDTATCQFSTDGGRTWNGTDLAMDAGTIDLGDGVTLAFDDAAGTKAFGANDIFHVNAHAAGYYRGNSEPLSLSINRGTQVAYNITGADAFTAAGGIDLFESLNQLKEALETNDVQGISAQLQNMKDAQNQVTLNQSLCGTKAQHIEVGRNNLAEVDEKLTALLSAVQDADLADLATKLSMKELALKTSYAMAAKIGNTTILDFIK